ncbi:MAG: TolB family protein [Pyrinomonadaceae bacterium]
MATERNGEVVAELLDHLNETFAGFSVFISFSISIKFVPLRGAFYYTLFAGDQTDPQHFRVPSLGGISERIPNIIASYIAFAPDGKRVAYAQSNSAAGQNYLVIADADGGNQQTIARKNHPNTFETQVPVVSWSPGGETIACLVNHFEADASYSSIVGFNLKDGSEKPLSEQRWYDVFSIEWLKDGSGLLISASDKVSGNKQIWLLSYPSGEARQITNDLNQYDSLSAAADGKSFITIQTGKPNGIFVGETGADDFSEIVSETGELHPFIWSSNEEIIFRSNQNGVSNLWTINADGSNRRQLTADAQVDSRGLCISPDGKYLVFASWRSGKSNLWRVEADGENLTQLTDGEADTRPQCSPGNQSVVYQSGLHTKPTLWKINLEGGEPVQLTDIYAKWNAVSNDGSRVSYFFMDDKKWRIGIISSDGGSILQRLDVPASLKENEIRWSPDDRSLFYIGADGSVGNVWNLLLDGGETKQITNFKTHYLEDFAWSPDGKTLAVSRSLTVSDAVLIERAE